MNSRIKSYKTARVRYNNFDNNLLMNNISLSQDSSVVTEFEITIAKSDLRFSCAHFVAYRGFREKLHGHNYQLSIKVQQKSSTSDSTGLGEDGYLIDFGIIKEAARSICKLFHERFICPIRSDVILINEVGTQVTLQCEDGAFFSLPLQDCLLVPLIHSTSEEIARMIYCMLIRKIGLEYLLQRGITTLDVTIEETANQSASFRRSLPKDEISLQMLETAVCCTTPCLCFDRIHTNVSNTSHE